MYGHGDPFAIGPFVAAGLAAEWRSAWKMARTKKENSLGSQDGMN
jgi:hypothetical protein